MSHDIWSRHDEEYRDPAEIIAHWQDPPNVNARLLEYETEGLWWDLLRRLGITLLVTREYEHLVVALGAGEDARPRISTMRLPHPSGLAIDRAKGKVYVASTRNPNQIFEMMPVQGLMDRLDWPGNNALDSTPLVPIRARFLPGCFYLHDLAICGGQLYATSVGQNAIIHVAPDGPFERVWWPTCIERPSGPIFGQNHLQLNSIAAGESLETSFFSASTDEVTAVRPGDPDFPVDRRGVIFSGASREAIVRGLTRPHSARFAPSDDGRLWVDNSGYGEVGFLEDGRFLPAARLPGWTRGLCFCQDVMFVGTSRVLPRFRQYAPGLELDASVCGVHALDVASGRTLGSIVWPAGNQIFSIEWASAAFTSGFPFHPSGRAAGDREKRLFYAFKVAELMTD